MTESKTSDVPGSAPAEITAIEKQIAALPRTPGVYIFKDEKGAVLYVGKARNRRQRVRQYFSPRSSDSRFFVSTVRRSAASVETISTSDEAEALILENNLIKELQPRYNIRLRDDKDYLCLRLDLRAAWPRLELVRRPGRDGARYFGPYSSAMTAKDLYRFLNRSFRLRTCGDRAFAARTRPCLQHQIGRCVAPCTLPVDRDAYARSVEQALMVLEGKTEELKARLQEEMLRHSRALEYEAAGRLRDLVAAVEAIEARQRVVDHRRTDADVIGFAREMDRMVVTLMTVRRGKVIGLADHRFSKVGSSDEETLRSFVVQLYGEGAVVPDRVLLDIPDRTLLEQFIRQSRRDGVRVLAPHRGKGRELVAMAVDNAGKALREWASLEEAGPTRLAYIAARLHLPGPPCVIECIDISHTSGKEVVGSLVAMVEGELAKSRSRRFKVRMDTRGDDFLAMQEVLTRRLRRGVRAEKGWELPDLLLIDGGRGHLNLAAALKRELGAGAMAVAAIAKDRRREETAAIRLRVREKILEEDLALGQTPPETGEKRTAARVPRDFDTIYVEGQKEGIPATRTTPLGLLVGLRDEAHRFAIRYHRGLRAKKSLSSELLRVKGVGPRLVARLYENFRDLDEIRGSGAREIARRLRISPALAERIKAALESPSVK
jgi:excinuclease ABC subunit C